MFSLVILIDINKLLEKIKYFSFFIQSKNKYHLNIFKIFFLKNKNSFLKKRKDDVNKINKEI